MALRRTLILVSWALSAVFLTGCPTFPPGSQSGSSEFPKVITGLGDSPNLPLRVGDFMRERVIAYTPEMDNISIGYNLYRPDRQMASTIYFYPIPAEFGSGRSREAMAAAFSAATREIMDAHSPARIEGQSEVSVRQPSGTIEGLGAVLRYRMKFAGSEQEVGSELYVFVYEGRFIKFRHTYPLGQRDIVRADLIFLMESLRWAVPEWETIPSSRLPAAPTSRAG